MKRLLLSLAISAPLLLAACNQNDDTASPVISVAEHGLFDYVPANSLWIQSDFGSIEKSAIHAQS